MNFFKQSCFRRDVSRSILYIYQHFSHTPQVYYGAFKQFKCLLFCTLVDNTFFLSQQGILACCNPVPPLVKQNLQTLHMIIFNARNKPLESLPASSLSLTASSSTSSALDAQLSNDTDYNENPLKCPLDLGPLTDGAAGITTLIDRSVDRIVRKFKPAAQPARPLVKAKADLAVFSGRSKTVKASSDGLKAEVQFVSPFRRYELLRPYLDSIEQQEQRAQLQQLQKHHLDTKPSDIDMRFVVFAPPPPPRKNLEVYLNSDSM